MSGPRAARFWAAPAACALLISLLLLPAAGAAPAAGGGTRLAASLLGPTPIVDDLQSLCDRIGGRVTGSASCGRAIDWFVSKFREAAPDRVWTEEFPMPALWQEGASRARIIAPETIPLRLAAMPFSPGTPKKGLEAAVIDLRDGEEADFAAAGARLRGAFGLVDSKVIVGWEDLFLDYLKLPPIVTRARAAGAAGLLLVGSRARDLLYRHVATFGEAAPFPMAILAREDGLRLARLAGGGSGTRVRLELDVRVGPAFKSRNVLAEIRGSERPEEIVLAGAHLDSWELGTGALDNGANCAMLLDVARQMAALGVRPRRTVRFALFTGEEQGMYGSWGYARDHRAELERHAAVVVFDTGTGRITGFSMGGRKDLTPLLDEALAAVAGYGAAVHTVDAFVGTDNFDFLLEGVPNLVANQEPANYMENYHASSDTFDKVDRRELKINAAIAAAVLWGLADAPARAPRQDRAAIALLLERTGLDAQMRTFSLWDAWEKGSRGRTE